MSIFFLVAVALAWTAVMLPAARRARRATPYSSAATFKRRLSVVAPVRARIARYVPRQEGGTHSGRYVIVPRRGGEAARKPSARSVARRRRQRVALNLLIGLAAATLATSIAEGGAWWEAHLVADALLVFYAAILIENRKRREETIRKVRSIGTQELSSDGSAARAVGGRRA